MGLCMGAAVRAAAGDLVVLGDSLSKEYAVTFLGIGGNLSAAHVRNWAEILDDRRNDAFDMGSFATFADWRLTGHALNWSIPGSFASDWRENLSNPATTPDELEAQLRNEASRVVIWLGGNDIRTRYGDLYDGRPAAAWIDQVAGDIEFVMDFVRQRNARIAMVVCGVPHLGGTPSKNAAHPYDPVKTGRVTAALDALNARLRRSAAARGAGYADVYAMTRELVTAPRWIVGGWKIEKRESSGGLPDALFLGDGFHPNWPAQAVFAQRILDAFNGLDGGRIPRLTNREIVREVLGQNADLTLNQWARGYEIGDGDRGWGDDPDGDGMDNIVEFALDLDPTRPDRHLLPRPWLDTSGATPRLGLSWQPRDPGNATFARITVQESGSLGTWTDVPAGSVTSSANNVRTVRRGPVAGGRVQLRIRAQLLP